MQTDLFVNFALVI